MHMALLYCYGAETLAYYILILEAALAELFFFPRISKTEMKASGSNGDSQEKGKSYDSVIFVGISWSSFTFIRQKYSFTSRLIAG